MHPPSERVNDLRPKRTAVFFLCLMALLCLPAPDSARAGEASGSSSIIWKFGTVAPQGVGYANQIKRLVLPVVQEASGGAIQVKVFWGGTMGDDPEIIRKMRFGHLNGAGLTGYGATLLSPELTVLTLPFLFENENEVDFIKKNMRGVFSAAMEKSQVYLFAWIDQDFDQIYSASWPMDTLAQFPKARFLTWYGPVEEELFKMLGTKPIPVRTSDILSALDHKLGNSLIAPAIFVVGSQMFSRLNYVNPMKIRYSPAVVVVRQEDWQALPQRFKDKYFELRDGLEAAFTTEIRHENKRFLAAIKKYGITEVTVAPEELSRMKTATRPLWDKLAGRMYPRELLDQILALLSEYRAKEGGAAAK
ncbi:MAG: TRAP transporter substrate-binding protein DctP [Thermodesulfobacteriota bacterium]